MEEIYQIYNKSEQEETDENIDLDKEIENMRIKQEREK